MARITLFAPLLLGACSSPAWHEDFDRLVQESTAVPSPETTLLARRRPTRTSTASLASLWS